MPKCGTSERFKELVTGEWIRINPRTSPPTDNAIRSISSISQTGQPLPLDNDDRRHLVIYPPPGTEALYDKVFLELRTRRRQAFYYYLMQRDLSGFTPEAATLYRSQGPPDRPLVAIQDRFATEIAARRFGAAVCPCLSTDFAAYLRGAVPAEQAPGQQPLLRSNRAPVWMGKSERASIPGALHRHRTENSHSPPLAALEKHRASRPVDQTEAAWLGDHCRRFSAATNGYAAEQRDRLMTTVRGIRPPVQGYRDSRKNYAGQGLCRVCMVCRRHARAPRSLASRPHNRNPLPRVPRCTPAHLHSALLTRVSAVRGTATKPKYPAGPMSQNLRAEMPTVAAWIDELREAFGADQINPAIKAGMNCQPTFWAKKMAWR